MNEYVVIYEQGEDGGWGAYVPDLPVFVVGSSKEDVEELMHDGLDLFVEEMQQAGEPLPRPAHQAGTALLPG